MTLEELEIFVSKSIGNPVNRAFMIIMVILFIYFVLKILKYRKVQNDVKKLLKDLKESESGRLNSEEYGTMEREIRFLNENLLEKNNRLYTGINLEDYFNSITLLEDKINVKELMSIPNIFPGIGILGTFIGLALGLSQINTTGTSQEILKSIEPILSSISIAFVTSIMGIFFSLVSSFWLNKFLGKAEENILRVESKLALRFPMYSNIFHKEELIKELKEIKTTTNGLATDISNQLGEHISTQVGEKIDTLVSGSNEIMGELTSQIGEKVERMTDILSNDFSSNLTESLDKIFTEDLTDKFKNIGDDMMNVSKANMDSLDSLKTGMTSVVLDLNDIKDNYETINTKIYETNESISKSLEMLSKGITDRTVILDENLEKTLNTYEVTEEKVTQLIEKRTKIIDDSIEKTSNLATKINEQSIILEDSLSKSLTVAMDSLDQLSGYMESNREISNSMERFMNSEEKILEMWNGYDKRFNDLNVLLIEGSKGFEESLRVSINSYKNQLNGIRDEFSSMMTTLNQKYSEYTNKNTMDLFKEYDHQLATAINKFGGLMNSLQEEIGELENVIEIQNEKIELAIDKMKPINLIENSK